MKITAITKFKQGTIWALLKKLGWSQSRLGQEAGLNATTIGRICNLKSKPTEHQANCIQRAFAKAGQYVDVLELWAETFTEFKNSPIVEQTAEIDFRLLKNLATPTICDSFKPGFEEIKAGIEDALNALPPREKFIIEQEFYENKTMPEIAKQVSLSKGRIYQIKAKALRRLRSSHVLNQAILGK